MSAPRAEVFALRLQPGREADYRHRHDAIWPELTQLFAVHGILAYEIHLHRDTGLLFAFRLLAPDADLSAIMDDPVMTRWRAHMADVLVQDDGHPVREALVPMYRFAPPRP